MLIDGRLTSGFDAIRDLTFALAWLVALTVVVTLVVRLRPLVRGTQGTLTIGPRPVELCGVVGAQDRSPRQDTALRQRP